VLKEKLEDVKKERDGYIAFEKRYKAQQGGGRKGPEEVDALRKKLEEVSRVQSSPSLLIVIVSMRTLCC
jgi:hypothetical protein